MKKEESGREKAEREKEYMEFMYGDKYEVWNCSTSDDRQLFCVYYDQIMEAIEEMKAVENLMIWVGFRKQMRSRTETMDRIIEEFA